MGATPPLRLSVSHYAAPADLPLEAFLEAVARHGFAGVGITRAASEAMPPDRLAREIAARGLATTSVNSAGYFLQPHADALAGQERLNRRLLEAAATLNAPLNVIPGGPLPAGLTLEAAREAIVPHLEALADAARAAGARLSLEPIGPAGLAAKGCVTQISSARALAGRIPGLSTTLDLFHSFWDADLPGLLDASAAEVAVLQVCDVRLSRTSPPARAPLGRGHLDLRGLLRRVAAARYPAPVEFEIFEGDAAGLPFERLLAETAAAWRALVPEAA